MASRFIDELPEKYLEKNSFFDEIKEDLDEFEFNQDFEDNNNLSRIGYDLFKSKKSKLKKRFIFKAFQRRFRPNLVNGLSDQECLLISKNLLNN